MNIHKWAQNYLDSSVWERSCSLVIQSRKSSGPLKVKDQCSKTESVERERERVRSFYPSFFLHFMSNDTVYLCFLLRNKHAVHSGLIHALPEDFVCLYLFMPSIKHGASFCESWLKNLDNHVKPSSSCFESLTCVPKGPLVCDIRVLIVMRVISAE